MMRWIYYPRDTKNQIMSNIVLTDDMICIRCLDPEIHNKTMIQSESAIILNRMLLRQAYIERKGHVTILSLKKLRKNRDAKSIRASEYRTSSNDIIAEFKQAVASLLSNK